MKSQHIFLNGTEYLKLALASVRQQGQEFYVSVISAKDLVFMYEVKPTEYDIKVYDALSARYPEDVDYYEAIKRREIPSHLEDDFQRSESKTRVSQIRKFILEDELPLFPNTIILTCELGNDIIDLEEGVLVESYVKDLELSGPFSYLERCDGNLCLFIPYAPKTVVVIDGQHRLKGLEEALLNKDFGYDVLVSFIIGYDRSLIARLFYTVNYTQKPVNKSLIYHLMGEFSRGTTEISFLHGVVKMLNELPNSPLYQRIKMLGTVPLSLSPDDKKKVTISQAFLIDYLLPTIVDRVTRGPHQPVFNYYYSDEMLHIELIRFIIKYFSAVKRIKAKEWENPSQSIICKTVSIGALIKIMHMVYIKLFVDQWKMDPLLIKGVSTSDIVDSLSGLESVDLSVESAFAKSSSAGSLNKLKEIMVSSIKVFDGDSYEDKLQKFHDNYIASFLNWYKSIKVSK